MILEVNYEGGGVFKVWPPPSEVEARNIVTAIKILDPGNRNNADAQGLVCEHGTPFRYPCNECSEDAL